jgi:acetoin utilization protein AcuB
VKIKHIMTPCPYYITAQSSLDDALKKMALHGIRHLPVTDNDELIGLVSERDLRLSQFVCKTTQYCPTVGQTCVGEVFIVHGDRDVAELADQMAREKRECAIICDEAENVIGIFTTTDAFKLIHLLVSGKGV